MSQDSCSAINVYGYLNRIYMRKRAVVNHLRLSAPDEEVEPVARIIKEEKETLKLQDFPVQIIQQ